MFVLFLLISTSGQTEPKFTIFRAVLFMALGLIVFWILIGGKLMYKYRDSIKAAVLKIPIQWQVKFVLFCTLLAMLEEAITTAMTNMAPLWGLEIGQAYITVSANYWQVVLGNSVIMFVPAFIAFAILLRRYDFSPNQIFLLFGLMGTLIETVAGGPSHLLEIGMWMFVYGLMVYLPAYTLPQRNNLKPVRFYHFILPFLLYPICLVLWAPIIAIIKALWPNIEYKFPPMQI